MTQQFRLQADPFEFESNFAAQSTEYEIFGDDNRILVPDTRTVPFRFICCIECIFTDPNTGQIYRERGSGTLISDRHVLTAAHIVHPSRLGNSETHCLVRPDRIVVAPGRNGTQMPFGHSETIFNRLPFEFVENCRVRQHEQAQPFDFALLTLQQHLGAPSRGLGFWGHPTLGGNTRIRPTGDFTLDRLTVNTSGYPSDKCLNGPTGRPATDAEINACNNGVIGPINFWNDRQGTTQWRSLGRVLMSALNRITFEELDSGPGQSGSPVWVRWKDFRNLVAVYTGGEPEDTAPFDIIANTGVRITPLVLERLRQWMRLDGVRANF